MTTRPSKLAAAATKVRAEMEISLIAAVCDAGRNYYREHPDDTLIAVARHAATLWREKHHQIAFLHGYSEARAQHEAFKRGE